MSNNHIKSINMTCKFITLLYFCLWSTMVAFSQRYTIEIKDKQSFNLVDNQSNGGLSWAWRKAVSSFCNTNYRYPCNSYELLHYVNARLIDELPSFASILRNNYSIYRFTNDNSENMDMYINGDFIMRFCGYINVFDSNLNFSSQDVVCVDKKDSFHIGTYANEIDSILNSLYAKNKIIPYANDILMHNGYLPIYRTIIVSISTDNKMEVLCNKEYARDTFLLNQIQSAFSYFLSSKLLKSITLGVIVPNYQYHEEQKRILSDFLCKDVEYNGWLSKLLSQRDYYEAYGTYIIDVDTFCNDVSKRILDPNYRINKEQRTTLYDEIKYYSKYLSFATDEEFLIVNLNDLIQLKNKTHVQGENVYADFYDFVFYDAQGLQIFVDKSVAKNDLTFYYVTHSEEGEFCITAVYKKNKGFYINNTLVSICGGNDFVELFEKYTEDNNIAAIKFPLPKRLISNE